MADISKIKTLDGTTYNIKDGEARDMLGQEILCFDFGSISSLPQTVSNSLITSNHILLRAELGTPLVQTGDWTVTTANGSVTVSGTISGSTTLKIVLGIQAN